MDRFGGRETQRGGSSSRKRSRTRLLLVLSLFASALNLATQSSPTSAAVGLMPSDWVVSCDTATNSVSITPVSNNVYTPGQSVAINLFQSSSTSEYFDAWGAITTISPSGVATVQLSSLQSNTGVPLGTGFTTDDKVWSVVLDDFTNQNFRLDAVTTAFVNGERVCRPQATNPPMPPGWEVECNVASNSIRIRSTDPNFLIPTSGDIRLIQPNPANPAGPPNLLFSAPLTHSIDGSPGGGVASVSLAALQSLIGTESFPTSPTNWVVVLSSGGINTFRVDALTTAIENSDRICSPPVLIVNIVDYDTEQVRRGAQVFAVPVQPCDVIAGSGFGVLSSGVLGTHVLSRGQVSPGLYWIGTAAPAGFASQWFGGPSCDAATQILVRSDGTIEFPAGVDVSLDPNGVPAITVRLLPGRVAQLTLKDSLDNPVNGACVKAWTWQPGAVWGTFVGDTCQSVNGVYRVPGIGENLVITLQILAPPGFRSQFVDANDFFGTAGFTVADDASGSFVSVVPGRTIPNEVTLRRAETIRGRVGSQGPNGEFVPASAVCVIAIDDANGNFSGATCTGSDGRFSLGVDPNRTYRVRIDGTRIGLGVTFYGGSTWGSAELVSVGAGGFDIGDVVLQSTASVPIEVRDTSGQPITRACVAAWGGDSYLQNVNTACYAPNGNFLLGGLEANQKYKFNVYAPGFRSTWYANSQDRAGATPVVAPSSETIQMSLVPGSGFRLKVKDSNGAEVAACLTAFKPTSASQWGEYIVSTCQPSGDVDLTSLKPGTSVALRVNTFNGSTSAGWLGRNGSNVVPVDLESRAIFIVPDAPEDLGVVQLNAAYIVAGQVTIAGQPTAGVCAEAFSVRPDSSVGSLLGVGCTDTDGRYGILGLPVGTPIRVRFSSPSLDVIPAWFSQGVPAGVSDPTLATQITSFRNDVNVNLTRGSSLQVTVIGEVAGGEMQASGAVSDVCVSAIDSQGRGAGRACSDLSGTALIRSLPEGTYTLWLQSSNPLYRSGLATGEFEEPVEVDVPESSQVTVTARTGEVVAGVVKLDGVAVADACVVATASGGTGSEGAADPVSCSDLNGNYRLVLNPDLTYAFSVVDGQEPARFARQDLDETFDGGEILLVSSSPASESMSAFVEEIDDLVIQSGSLFLTSATSDSVTLRWETDTPGLYTVTAKIGNNSVFETETLNKQLTILGLVQGPPYLIEVRAGEMSVGTVSVRTSADLEGPPLPPGKPSVAVDGKSVSISWSPVSSASPVQYVAYLFDALTNNVVAEVSTASLSAVFDNLDGPAAYVARVVAINNAGSSPLSSPSDVANIRGRPPGQPRALAASEVPGGFQIDWSPPLDTGGATTLGYDIEVSPVALSELTQASAPPPCSTTALTCTFTDLVANTTYEISVVAFSGSGRSAPVSIERLFVGLSVPEKPGDVRAVSGDGRVVVSWAAPTSDGGSPILGYTVTAEPGGRTCTTTALRCTINRLTNGIRYTFSVIAENAIGSSDPAESAETLIAVPPSAPTRLSAKALSGTSVRVSWSPPRSDGGVAITGYQIRYSTSGGRPVGEWISVGDSSSSGYTIESLPRGTQVIVEVRAINATFNGTSGTVRVRTPSRG